MFFDNTRMFRFAPDEGGGGDGGETAELPDVITVGDQEFSREQVLERLGNYDKLQEGFTQSRQSISRLEGRLDELSQQRAKPPETANEPEKPPERPDFEAQIAGLDKYADDYDQRLSELMRQEREFTRSELQREVQQLDQRFDQRLTQQERAQRIQQSNRELVQNYLNDPDRVTVELTAEERAAVEKDMTAHIGDAYGQFDADTQMFAWNEKALDAAMWNVPSVREKMLAQRTAQARDEGLQGRARGQRAGRSTPNSRARGSSEPTSFEEQINLVRQMPLDQAQNYMEAHPDFADRYLEAYRTRGG